MAPDATGETGNVDREPDEDPEAPASTSLAKSRKQKNANALLQPNAAEVVREQLASRGCDPAEIERAFTYVQRSYSAYIKLISIENFSEAQLAQAISDTSVGKLRGLAGTSYVGSDFLTRKLHGAGLFFSSKFFKLSRALRLADAILGGLRQVFSEAFASLAPELEPSGSAQTEQTKRYWHQ